MDFFSGLKKAYEKIETELNKSLNIEGGEHTEGEAAGGDTASPVDVEASQTDSSERNRQNEDTAEDGWGSWGETDPVGGHVLTSGTAAQSLGEDPVRSGLSPQPHRSAVSDSQPSSASLPPSKPERAPMESTGRMAHPTSPQPKDTRPKTPPTSPPQKDSQSKIPPMSPPQDTTPKTPPTSPPQDSATLLTSVAASPQHGTPAKGVAGKLEGLPREDLIKYIKKQAQMVQKLKTKNEELNKVCEQLNSKGSEQESDHRSMQSEALVEELQIMKSQCDRLTTEHQQSKSLCRQLESERDDLVCELDTLKTKLACSLELLDQQKTENSEGLEELRSELQKARASNTKLELELESSTAVRDECQQRLQDAELVIAELQEESHQRELKHEKDLVSLTEELQSAQHASQSLEQQLFELRERHVMGAEVEQKQLQAEAESLRKDLQQLHHDKVELQREIEQRSSELTTSREEVEAVREELKAVREEVEAVRDSMLAKSNEAEQAQGLVHQQQEEVARLEARCQDLSAQLHLLREEQASVKEGESTSVGDTAKQTKEEVESLHSLLGERCKELEEARRRGDRRTEELAEAQERIKAVEAQVAVVEGERRGLSEHLEEWRLKVTAVEAELEEARRDLEREREDNRRKSMDMQQEAEKWRADASKTESLQERLASTEVERDRLSALVHEMNETLSGSEQKRLSEQQAHLEVLKGAEGEAARLRDRVEELAAELSVSQGQCESVSAELERTQQQSQQLSRELEERVASLALMGDQSGKELHQLRTELQTAEQQVRELSKRAEEQERQYQDLRTTCAQLESELANSRQESSERLAQVEQKDAEGKELRSQLSVCTQAQEASEKENVRSTKRVAELEEEVSRLESSVTRVQQELETTKDKLLKTEKDVKASTLMDLELADYQHTVHSLEATVADKEQELQDAWLAKEKQGTVVEELRKQLSESETVKGKSEEKMLKLKGLLKKTHNELTEAKKNESELNQTISDLQSQLQQEQLRSEEAKVQVSELTVKLAVSDQQNQSSVGTLQAALRHQEGRSKSLQEELGALQETLKMRDKEFESYKVRAQSVLKQRSVGTAAVDAEGELRQSFEHQLSQLKEEAQTANDRLSATLADLEELSEEHDQLARRHEKVLADVQASESQWEKKYLELRTHYTAAQEEKEELTSQLRQEVQHVSQAYKDQITVMQKEHNGAVDGLREELRRLETELQSAHNNQHQQQLQQPAGSAPTPRDVPERVKGRHEEVKLVLPGLGVVAGSEPRSDGEGMEQPDHAQASQTVDPAHTPGELSVPRTPAESPLVSLERLLNGDTWAQETLLASSPVASLTDAQVRRQLIASSKKTEHLTEVLRESEANSMRLADQAKLLKEEIRRLERNKDREESVSSMEYLKNVILKFLHTTGQEQAQLVPVITSLLKLSQQERVFVEEVLKGNNPSVPDPGGSPLHQASKGKGLSSYIHRWTGY